VVSASSRTNVFTGEAQIYDQFIDNILPTVIGRDPRTIKGLNISISNIEKLDPKLTISSKHDDENGKPITLAYTFHYSDNDFGFVGVHQSDGKIEKAFNIPKNLDISELEKFKDGLRSLFVADPFLNRRFVSDLPFSLEPFQESAVQDGLKGFEEKDSSLIVMPTGTGKTEVAWTILDQHLSKLKSQGNKAIFIVNNKLILDDAAAKLKKRFGAKYRTSKIYDSTADFSGDVIFATPVSLSNKMQKLLQHLESRDEKIAMFIYDEVHHLPAETYSETLRILKKASMDRQWDSVHAGFSATPERMDRLDVFRFFGKKIDFDFPIDNAWSQGYLAPLDIVLADNDINPGDVCPVLPKTRLWDLYQKMRYDDKRLAKLQEVYKKDVELTGKEGKSLIIVKDNDTAEAVAENFRNSGCDAVALTSRQKDSSFNPEYSEQYFEDHYKAWKFGKWRNGSKYSDKPVPKIAVAVDMFKEGVDVPDINRLILARYTNSLGTLLQTIGRGLRPAPLKQNLRLIDFVGQLRNIDVMQFMAQCGAAFTDLHDATKRKSSTHDPSTIDFNDSYVDSVKDFMSNVPYLLERRYITYENIIDPREIRKLDLFFAEKLGADMTTQEGALKYLNKYLEDFVKEVQSDGCNTKKLRDSLYPLMTFDRTDPKGRYKNNPWLTDGPAQIMYSHLLERLNEICSQQSLELNMDYIDSILPEFSQKENQISQNISQNMKFLRQKVLRFSREELVESFRAKNNLFEQQKENKKLIESIKSGITILSRGKDKYVKLCDLKALDSWGTIIAKIEIESKLHANQDGEVLLSDLISAIEERAFEARAELSCGTSELVTFVACAEGAKSSLDDEEKLGFRNYDRTQRQEISRSFIDGILNLYMSYQPVIDKKLLKDDFKQDPEKFKEILIHKGVYQGQEKKNKFISLFNAKVKALAESIDNYDREAEASHTALDRSITAVVDLINATNIGELDLDGLDTRNINQLKKLYENLRSKIDNSDLEADELRRIYDALNIIYRPVFVIDEVDLGGNKRAVLTKSNANADANDKHKEEKYNIEILDCQANSETNVFQLWDQNQLPFKFSSEPNMLGDLVLIMKPSLSRDNAIQRLYDSTIDNKAQRKIFDALIQMFETIEDRSNRRISVVLPNQEDAGDSTFMPDFAQYIHDNTGLDLMAGTELKYIDGHYYYKVPNNMFIHLFRTSHCLEALKYLKNSKNSIFQTLASLGTYKKFYEPRIQRLCGAIDDYVAATTEIRFGEDAAKALKKSLSRKVHWKVHKDFGIVRLLTEGHYFSESNEITEEYINYAYLRLVGSKEIYVKNNDLLRNREDLNAVLNKYLDLKKYTLEDANEQNIAVLGEANLLFRGLVDSNLRPKTVTDVKTKLKNLEQRIDPELKKRTRPTSYVTSPALKPQEASFVTPPYITKEDKEIALWMTKRGKNAEIHWDPNCLKVANPSKGTKVERETVNTAPFFDGKFKACQACNTPFFRKLEELNKTPFQFLNENPDREID
jgi:superfamily II DNA or RNA helicase